MHHNFWNYVNYALVFVAVILMVVIGAIYFTGNELDKPTNNETNETLDWEVEKDIKANNQDFNPKKEELKKIEGAADNSGTNEEIDELDKESKNKEDIIDNDKNDEDTDSADKQEPGEKKTLTGVLEKAEEDNDFGGNYKIKLAGNSEYTYLFLSDAMVEDDLIGQLVELEVEYQEDGTFNIIGGPNPVN